MSHTRAGRQDWEFCRARLSEVSRTFVRPIELLPENLQVAVTCGYLLCRIADTVEDHPSLALEDRTALYGAFLDVLEGGADPRLFTDLYLRVGGRRPEHDLCTGLARVMRVFSGLPEDMKEVVIPWVAEMTRGMSLYSHRRAGRDGIVALHTSEDLLRYCYYVAGTVGHLVTELFLEAVDLQRETALLLRRHAESFGVGLQLVNVLKDVTDDLARNVSFVPRTCFAAAGIAPRELLDPSRRAEAHRAVEPIFETARLMLDRALEYALAVPSHEARLRLFCLLPLWMAARTWVHARGNDAMFIPDRAVKISRLQVEALIAECVRYSRDDEALRAGFDRLWSESWSGVPHPPA